jgi:cellulose synthase/poly-beta-1,6-N-acetylglucosamine synthase-like glycosyltransferase
MKLGVCIPCHANHLDLLPNCLESIRQQTRVPDVVVVSVSSATTYPELPCRVLVRSELICAGENRNIAARSIADTVDVLTFIDADDVMHPRRIEMIEKHFTDHPELDYFVHSYTNDGAWADITGNVRMNPFVGVRRMDGDKCGRVVGDGLPPFHNGHISCRSAAWKENPMLERYGDGEDSEYTARMWEKGYTFGVTSDALSWYKRGHSIPFSI